jgi:hypothetical protein
MPTDLPALYDAARAAVDVPGTEPIRWRVVSIEYGGGIAPVCTATSYTTDADLGGATSLTHRLDPDVFGPDARDETGLYDCCPTPWIEVGSEEMAAYLVGLLNADADRPSNPADLGEWIRCGHPRCPNSERDGVAEQRGWVAWPHRAWSCPQHTVIPTSQEM